MRACAVVVVGEDGAPRTTDTSGGVYEGTVSADEAAESSRHHSSGVPGGAPETAVESLDVWLRDARAALTGENREKNGVVVVHCLRQHENEQTLTLCWKLKDKFCAVALGSIRLSKVTAPSGLVGQMSVKFVEPLMSDLRTERRRCERAISAASETADQLLEDNRRLMRRIESMAESRGRDDERTMARFLRILNAKKLRIADMERELSRLQRNVGETVDERVDERETLSRVTGRRGRGAGRCRGARKKTNLENSDERPENGGTVFKKRKTDSARETTLEDVVDVVVAVPDVGEKRVTEFPVADNTTPDPFEAPTQVDPVSDGSPVSLSPPASPPWIQRMEPPDTRSSPMRTLRSSLTQSETSLPPRPSEQKSVLDSLWHGIV